MNLEQDLEEVTQEGADGSRCVWHVAISNHASQKCWCRECVQGTFFSLSFLFVIESLLSCSSRLSQPQLAWKHLLKPYLVLHRLQGKVGPRGKPKAARTSWREAGTAEAQAHCRGLRNCGHFSKRVIGKPVIDRKIHQIFPCLICFDCWLFLQVHRAHSATWSM